jgi:Zn-dependent peptidase ImmA (M78 family)
MNSQSELPRRSEREQVLRPLATILRNDLMDSLRLADDLARNPFVVAEALGVRVEYLAMGHGCGRLFRVRDGWAIVLPEMANESRQRFACAHELGHYLVHARRADVKQALAGWGRIWGEQRVEEWVCDLFAQELLLPERALTSAIAALNLGTFMQITREFQTSLQAAAIRIATLSAAYAFVFATVPRERRTHLVVDWTATPPPIFLPARKRISADSCFARSLASRRPLSDWEVDPLGVLRGWYHTEVTPLERRQGVVALIHLNRRQNKGPWRQLPLTLGSDSAISESSPGLVNEGRAKQSLNGATKDRDTAIDSVTRNIL